MLRLKRHYNSSRRRIYAMIREHQKNSKQMANIRTQTRAARLTQSTSTSFSLKIKKKHWVETTRNKAWLNNPWFRFRHLPGNVKNYERKAVRHHFRTMVCGRRTFQTKVASWLICTSQCLCLLNRTISYRTRFFCTRTSISAPKNFPPRNFWPTRIRSDYSSDIWIMKNNVLGPASLTL